MIWLRQAKSTITDLTSQLLVKFVTVTYCQVIWLVRMTPFTVHLKTKGAEHGCPEPPSQKRFMNVHETWPTVPGRTFLVFKTAGVYYGCSMMFIPHQMQFVDHHFPWNCHTLGIKSAFSDAPEPDPFQMIQFIPMMTPAESRQRRLTMVMAVVVDWDDWGYFDFRQPPFFVLAC